MGCQQANCPSSQETLTIIDSHVHITPTTESIDRALSIFEANNITKFCTKNAGFAGSNRFRATINIKKRLGDRFAFFVNINWQGFGLPGWTQREIARLENGIRQGARGVKIFKNLGLGVRTPDGKLVSLEHPQIAPLLEKVGQLGAIVAIHTADPLAFFEPPGPRNERYIELLFAPSWSFYGKDFPSRAELLAGRDRLLARHPQTTFLGIHFANNPEDLNYLDNLLSKHKNLYIDTSARLGEIGRHPTDKVRAFFIKHQDRILFGSDLIVGPSGLQLGSLSIWPDDDSDADDFYQAHREYFETDHRQIDHPTPIQGDWKVDGIKLPKDVLKKLYSKNAEQLIWK
jgi:predicted TIM-barrel fold metal-dependent hydrolase